MAKELQTTKTFSYGQCSLSGFSNITDNYSHSCKKLKNAIVENNGSIRVRGAWEDDGVEFELGQGQTFRDIYRISNSFLVWLEGKKSAQGGLFFYDKSTKTLKRMEFSIQGTRFYGEELDEASQLIEFPQEEQFADHGLDIPQRLGAGLEIVSVERFENQLFVFFKNSFPFAIRSEGDVIAVVPYWEGVGAGNIWKAFPFNYTATRKTLGSFYFRQPPGQADFVPAVNEEENLRLRIKDVSISNRECKAWIEPNLEREPPSQGISLDKRYANLQKFLGMPIAFRVGLKDLKIVKTVEVSAEIDAGAEDVFYDKYSSVLSQCRTGGYTLYSGSVGLSQFYDGWVGKEDHIFWPTFWRVNKKSVEDTIERWLSTGYFGRGIFINNLYGFRSNFYNTTRSTIRLTDVAVRIFKNLIKSHAVFRAFGDILESQVTYRQGYFSRSGNPNFRGDLKRIRDATDGIKEKVEKYLKGRIRKIVATSSPLCNFKRMVRGEFKKHTVILPLNFFFDFDGARQRAGMVLTDESIADLESGIVDRLAFNPYAGNRALEVDNPIYMTQASSQSFLKYIQSDGFSTNIPIKTEKKGFAPSGEELSGTFTASNPEGPEDPLPDTILNGVSGVDTAQQVLAKEAYNFYVIFPYEIVAPVAENNPARYIDALKQNELGSQTYAKCKIYEIGSQLSRDDIAGDNLGGNLESNHYLHSEDFIITDWADGWPKSGGVLNDKHFFFTSGSKLSFSRTNKPQIWGNPIKKLLKAPAYNLEYQEDLVRPNDASANDGESSRFETLLREDFKYPTQAMKDFFDAIRQGDDSREVNVSDPLTYRLEDKNGELVDVRKHHVLSLGVLTNVGVQCVFMSDKGVFYFGLTPREKLFLKLAHVSNFIGGESDNGHDFSIVEILSLMFATSQDKEIHAVKYDTNNKNFNAMPSGVDRGFKGFVHGVSFIGNRLLFIDADTEKMFCCNVSSRGELMGVSEWAVGMKEAKGLWKFDNDFYGAFQEGNRVEVLKYNDAQSVEKGNPLMGEVETAPMTWISRYGTNPMLHLDISFRRAFFFAEGQIAENAGDIIVQCVGVNDKLFDVKMSQVLKNTRNKGQNGILSMRKDFRFSPGQGFSFKFKNPVVVSGVALELGIGD